MKLAVISYAFHELAEQGMMDLFGYLETCKYRFGLEAADIWNGMLASTEEEYLRKVKAALDERELTVANLAVDDAHIWEDDPEVREHHYQNALAHLHAAEVLGAWTVRIDTGGSRNATAWTGEQLDWIVKRYREYAQRAADNGYRVGPENHWGPEVYPATLKGLCEAVDHPAFGVLLHFRRWRGPDAGQGDDLLAPWVMHTHVGRGFSDEALYEKMTALRDRGYDGYWSVEHTSTRYSEIGLCLARMRDVLEQWRTE